MANVTQYQYSSQRPKTRLHSTQEETSRRTAKLLETAKVTSSCRGKWNWDINISFVRIPKINGWKHWSWKQRLFPKIFVPVPQRSPQITHAAKPLPASDRPTFLSSMLDLGSLSNSPGRGSRPKWVHAETMPTNIEFDAFLSIDSRHGLLKSALLKRD